MTLEEAKKIASAIGNADGGCPYCVRDLCEEMATRFPEFVWSFDGEEIPSVESGPCETQEVSVVLRE